MSEPKNRSPEQEVLDAQRAVENATKVLAQYQDVEALVEKHAGTFQQALAAFEGVLRENKVTPSQALIIASAVQSNVLRHLLNKCGKPQDDSLEETQKIDELRSATHALVNTGKRFEKRLISKSTVVGVGRMTLDNSDVSTGKTKK